MFQSLYGVSRCDHGKRSFSKTEIRCSCQSVFELRSLRTCLRTGKKNSRAAMPHSSSIEEFKELISGDPRLPKEFGECLAGLFSQNFIDELTFYQTKFCFSGT